MVRAEALKPADILAVLWRYRLALIVALAVGAAGSYGYSLTLPNQYQATTLVLVEEDTLSSSYVRSPVTVDLEARLRTLRDQVLSRTRLQEVMGRYRLFSDQSSWELRLSEMRDRTDVSVSRTDAFRISFTYPDPVIARDVTNALAQLFIEDSRSAMVRQSEGTSSILDQRMNAVVADLSLKEDELAEFKARHRGSLPEEISDTVSSRDFARSQLNTTSADLAAARDRLTRLERLMVVPVSAGGESLTARQVARQLLAGGGADVEERIATQPTSVRLEARRLQRETLLKQVTARHPDVRFLDMEIESLESQLATEVADPDTAAAAVAGTSDLLGAQLDDARRQITLLEQRRSDLQNEIAGFEQRIAAAPAVEQELRDLERQYDSLDSEFRELRNRRMEAGLAGNLDADPTGGFKVLDPAVAPERKSSPARTFFLLAGAVAGLGLAVGSAFAYEMIAQPVHGVAELERHLGLPVLSAIPAIPNRSRRRRRLLSRLAAAVVVIAAVAGVLFMRLLT